MCPDRGSNPRHCHLNVFTLVLVIRQTEFYHSNIYYCTHHNTPINTLTTHHNTRWSKRARTALGAWYIYFFHFIIFILIANVKSFLYHQNYTHTHTHTHFKVKNIKILAKIKISAHMFFRMYRD